MNMEVFGMVFPSWAALPDLGLYMDQVMTLMTRVLGSMPGGGEITKSMVNNYVKAGLIRRPSGKKYDRDQLAQLIMIAVLKQALSMDEIAALLGMLCSCGTWACYDQFLEEVDGLRKAVVSGRIDLWLERADEQRQALRAGVVAAICTIFAREMISGAKAKNI